MAHTYTFPDIRVCLSNKSTSANDYAAVHPEDPGTEETLSSKQGKSSYSFHRSTEAGSGHAGQGLVVE